MDSPKVSVIIPMYNTAKFISTCIESVLLQTLKEIEIIVIDDCSTDDSYEFVRKVYADPSSNKYDPRLKLFRNIRNVGVGLTRNRGIEIASGKYLQFVDSDDAITGIMLETLYDRAKKNDLDVLYVNSILVSKDPNFTLNSQIAINKHFCFKHEPRTISNNIIDRIQQEFIGSGLWWMPVVKLIRRELLTKNHIYFPNMFSGEDMLLQLATFFFIQKAELIDGGYYVYRYRAESITHTPDNKYLRETVQSYSEALRYMRELWKKLPMDFSRENQILIETFVIYELMKMHCSNRNLTMIEIDEILEKVSREGIAIDPAVTKSLILYMIHSTRWMNSKDRDKIPLINLKS